MRKTLNLNSNKNTKARSDEGEQPVLTKFRDIKPEKLDWLWKDRIPIGKVTLLVGDPGTGKSFLTLYMASHVSTGEPWPDNSNEPVTQGSVIILTAEDDLADTVRVRLEAAGADLDRVLVIEAVDISSGDKKKRRGLFNLTKDLEVLKKAIAKTSDLRLLIIDPISAYMGGKNSNSNTDVREFLAPLAKLASVHSAAIVGVSHLNKNPMVPAAYRTLGSIGFTAAARAVWLVAKDPDDEDRRLLLPAKGNLAKRPTGLAFKLADAQVETDSGPISSAVCEFEPGTVDKTADEALWTEHKSQRGPSAIEQAKQFLNDALSNGPKPAKEIYLQAEEDGIAKRTINRAKRVLKVRSRPEASGESRRWIWSLPDPERKCAKNP